MTNASVVSNLPRQGDRIKIRWSSAAPIAGEPTARVQLRRRVAGVTSGSRPVDELIIVNVMSSLLKEGVSTIRQALIPHRPSQRQVVWAIRLVVALTTVVITLILVSSYGLVSSDNAALVGALLALAGVLIAQVVNTNIARATQRNQQILEGQRARAASLHRYSLTWSRWEYC
jgi:hypothetical protein